MFQPLLNLREIVFFIFKYSHLFGIHILANFAKLNRLILLNNP